MGPGLIFQDETNTVEWSLQDSRGRVIPRRSHLILGPGNKEDLAWDGRWPPRALPPHWWLVWWKGASGALCWLGGSLREEMAASGLITLCATCVYL